MSPEGRYRTSVTLTAQVGTVVATCGRIAGGGGIIEPDPALSHAANFLYMLTGKRPSQLEAQALDVALVLHADHEFNASTFAARVAAATLTDVHSAVTGAIGALKGPLHGGANTDVMNLLLEIGQDATDQKVEEIIRAQARQEREDSRLRPSRVSHGRSARHAPAEACRKSSCTRTGNRRWFEISQKIEQVVKAQKKLNANVDFYSATTYYALGIPVDLFTPVFAVSRMSGWTAHVLEQYANNRLIRPRAEYTGPRLPADLRSARSTIMGSDPGYVKLGAALRTSAPASVSGVERGGGPDRD